MNSCRNSTLLAVMVLALLGCGMPDRATGPAGRIAFVVTQDAANADLAVINADGSQRRLLTDTAEPELYPAWSPDGTRLVFSATAEPIVGGRGGRLQLYIMPAEGGARKTITAPTSQRGDDLMAAWSPDGTRIAFTRHSLDRLDENGLPHSDLYLINADGTQLRQLTQGLADERNPSWSPDGTRLAYAANGPSEPVPAGGIPVPSATPFPPTPILPSATMTPPVVPSTPPNVTPRATVAYPAPPSTAPSSTRAYPPPATEDSSAGYPFALRLPQPANDIYVLELASSQVRNLTNSPAHESEPAWQP